MLFRLVRAIAMTCWTLIVVTLVLIDSVVVLQAAYFVFAHQTLFVDLGLFEAYVITVVSLLHVFYINFTLDVWAKRTYKDKVFSRLANALRLMSNISAGIAAVILLVWLAGLRQYVFIIVHSIIVAGFAVWHKDKTTYVLLPPR